METGKRYEMVMTPKGIRLKNEDGGIHEAREILDIYPTRRVYLLNGQMGTGKTTFITTLAEEMGVEDTINSPTFAIVNVYTDGEGKEIYHFDCYRLKNIGEAIEIGTEDYLYSGNYCFIEWPEIINDLLPEEIVNIDLKTEEDKHYLTIR